MFFFVRSSSFVKVSHPVKFPTLLSLGTDIVSHSAHAGDKENKRDKENKGDSNSDSLNSTSSTTSTSLSSPFILDNASLSVPSSDIAQLILSKAAAYLSDLNTTEQSDPNVAEQSDLIVAEPSDPNSVTSTVMSEDRNCQSPSIPKRDSNLNNTGHTVDTDSIAPHNTVRNMVSNTTESSIDTVTSGEPPGTLDLQIPQYRLNAVVRHIGVNAFSGHYICDTLHQSIPHPISTTTPLPLPPSSYNDNNDNSEEVTVLKSPQQLDNKKSTFQSLDPGSSWHRNNDSLVTPLEEQNVLEEMNTPYIFFYSRVIPMR